MVCVIVEDCVDKVLNCFELVMFVVYCVCEVLVGLVIIVDCDNDKNFVVVLCEIVEEIQLVDDLCECMIELYQIQIEVDELEDDVMVLLMGVEVDKLVVDDMLEEKLFCVLMEVQGQC